MELVRSRGVRGERTDHTKKFRRTLAGFGLTGRQKVHFSTFDGNLESQCTRNGPGNPPFCPGSLQNTFIISSSISHHQIFENDFAKIQNLENRKSESLEIQKPRFTDKCPDFWWEMDRFGDSWNPLARSIVLEV